MGKLNLRSLLRYAGVSERGAVLLGSTLAVDGPHGRPLRAVSHIHSDHLVGLRESARRAELIVATPATLEMLVELGYRIPLHKRRPLKYGEPLEYMDDTVTLHRARHIVGAAQTLVETGDGVRVAYTGDFKLPGTPILRDLDVLVIEATYGRPEWVRPFKDKVEELLGDLVLEALSKGPVYVYGYHGKLQEAMEILRRHGVDAPFIAPSRIYRVTRIAVKHGLEVGELLENTWSEAADAMRSAWYVCFDHMHRSKLRYQRLGTHIILSGWEFQEPLKRIDSHTWLVALSDHADFEDLMSYVEEAKPRLVLTDAYRDGAAHRLALEIRRRLGIPAKPAPSSVGLDDQLF